MITAYSWLKVLHIFAALWVAVSAFGGTVLRASVRRAPDLAARMSILRAGIRVGMIFGLGGGIAVGLSGLALAIANPIYLKMGWVHASIGLWLLLLGMNILYLAPRARRLLAAGEASLAAGAPTDEFKRLAAHPVPPYLAELPAIAVVLFVLLMVLRPF
jgi:uncharacterized membrane protein